MTNEEKALKISGLKERPDDEERYYNSFGCKIYDIALEIAEWKDQQMIEKAVEWLELNIQGGVHPQSTISFIKQFKQAMKGE